MDQVHILHGPNLNLLGSREPGIYGSLSLDEINVRLIEYGSGLNFEIHPYQSNHEGDLVDRLHTAGQKAIGVILNAAAYTHTSVAIRDAISAIETPVIEVHLSNVHARESFRQQSWIAPVCVGTISGFGWHSYVLGLQALSQLVGKTTT
jgi:3-dehydroquinate dehydratase II